MLLLSPTLISIRHSTDSNCCPFCILVKIFVLSEPSTSSTLSYITLQFSVAFVLEFSVETKQASPMITVFLFGYILPEE